MEGQITISSKISKKKGEKIGTSNMIILSVIYLHFFHYIKAATGGEIFEVLDLGVPSTHERLQPPFPLEFEMQTNITMKLPKQ